jgi:hypothetical protein
MESTLFTTLSTNEEANLSGGFFPARSSFGTSLATCYEVMALYGDFITKGQNQVYFLVGINKETTAN